MTGVFSDCLLFFLAGIGEVEDGAGVPFST